MQLTADSAVLDIASRTVEGGALDRRKFGDSAGCGSRVHLLNVSPAVVDAVRLATEAFGRKESARTRSCLAQ